MNQERRKHIRYEIQNAVSVDSEGVFQIVDISRGGFRFKCPPHTSISDNWVADIINSVVPIEGVPVRKIWVSIHESERFNQPFIIMVGAKFGKLNKENKLNLIKLLQSKSLRQMFEEI